MSTYTGYHYGDKYIYSFAGPGGRARTTATEETNDDSYLSDDQLSSIISDLIDTVNCLKDKVDKLEQDKAIKSDPVKHFNSKLQALANKGGLTGQIFAGMRVPVTSEEERELTGKAKEVYDAINNGAKSKRQVYKNVTGKNDTLSHLVDILIADGLVEMTDDGLRVLGNE